MHHNASFVRQLPSGFQSPNGRKKRASSRDPTPPPTPEPEMTDRACSPHAQVRPKYTPEADKHAYFNMRADRAESLLMLVRRPRNDDLQKSTRPKTLAVLKRKLMTQLRVPTRSNPSFHLYREVDILPGQAAKSIFFDIPRTGPVLRGNSVYYNWETDNHELMAKWFALHERRKNGIHHAMMRSHGMLLVMARPPLLVEHQSNEEADGIKLTCGVMTLHCRGVPRFAPPPPPDLDNPQEAALRQQRADKDLAVAWELVKELAERETCHLDRHWYYSLAERFGRTWLSYLTEAIDTSESDEPADLENSEAEEAD